MESERRNVISELHMPHLVAMLVISHAMTLNPITEQDFCFASQQILQRGCKLLPNNFDDWLLRLDEFLFVFKNPHMSTAILQTSSDDVAAPSNKRFHTKVIPHSSRNSHLTNTTVFSKLCHGLRWIYPDGSLHNDRAMLLINNYNIHLIIQMKLWHAIQKSLYILLRIL